MGLGLELRSAWALRQRRIGLRVGIPYAQSTVAPNPAHAAVWVPFFFGYPPITGSAAITLDGLDVAGGCDVAVSAAAASALDDLALLSDGDVAVSGGAALALEDVQAASEGAVVVLAASALALEALGLAGAADLSVSGAGPIVLTDAALDAVAAVAVHAELGVTLADLVSAAVASMSASAHAAIALRPTHLTSACTVGTPETILALPGLLPPGVFGAPDLKGLPWRRLRGDEWTTPETRAVILAWIRQLVADDPAIRAWSVEELRSGYSGSSDPRMIIAVTSKTGARLEVGFHVSPRDMTPAGIAYLLAEAKKTLRFTR